MDKGAIKFNPYDLAFRTNPYKTYDLLRVNAPSYRTLGTLVLTQYQDVRTALKSRDLSVSLVRYTVEKQAERFGIKSIRQALHFLNQSIVFTDDPHHGVLRRLIGSAYHTSHIQSLSPMIHKRVENTCSNLDNEFDVVAELADPLPISILADWIGIPESYNPIIGPKINAIRGLLDPGMLTKSDFKAGLDSLKDFTTYLITEVIGRNKKGKSSASSNLVKMLLDSQFDGQKLTDEEIAFACIMTFVAGTETTSALIANSFLAFSKFPEQYEILHRSANHEIPLTKAIDEVIRFETPLQMTKRVATKDMTINDIAVSEGEQILLCLGAANRDPQIFNEPERFDVSRQDSPHVGFGYGLHLCLGGLLARLQVDAVLSFLLKSDIRPVQSTVECDWQTKSLILRAPEHLNISLENM